VRAAPAGSSKVASLSQEVTEDCHSLVYMVTEIDKSIDAAERNPQRFRLSQAEISERRKWVMSTRRQVDAIASGTAAPRATMSATSTPAAAAQPSGPASATTKLAAAVHDENDRFIASESDRQQVMMARQDQELDVLGDHVVRIGQLGREMGQELELQGQMLDDLGYEMDGTQTRLAAAQKKVQYVLDKAGSRGQLMIIAVLVVVLVVLIFLVIA